MRLKIPDFSLVVLIGASGSGKSTFAARHFLETEVVSSDRCRALVADDETDQRATGDAFDVLYKIVAKRLAARRLAVIDATNLRPADRTKTIEAARTYHALPVAIVFDLPAAISIERNALRANRAFGGRVVHEHVRMVRSSLKSLRREGFRAVYVFDDVAAIDAASIEREPLYSDRRAESGPFDIIGDVHGCYDELRELLDRLGYTPAERDGRVTLVHPDGRRAIFLGDLVDRGPGVVETLRLVMDMVAAQSALCVPGNHENKLGRALSGRNVTISHGLAESLAQIDALEPQARAAFVAEVSSFIENLVSHYWLDAGKLVVAHAGLRAEMHGRGSKEVREFALYGETTGETDEFGLPVRFDWAAQYRGTAKVVYGHTPVARAQWVNGTICIDTGCVYGGSLTTLRYPELELVSTPAHRTYVEAVRPIENHETEIAVPSAQHLADDVLDLADVSGKRRIVTRYATTVTIPEDRAAAALEVMSRFCVDPRWLMYLPPTMSPAETSKRENVLEHPDEAFAYFRKAGVARVVLKQKHMGSRAAIVVARDEVAARQRFGVESGAGVIATRTGRAFFTGAAAALGEAVLQRLREALDATQAWWRFETDWFCIDTEIMPWSVKAQALIDTQYAPVGQAAIAGLAAAEAALAKALLREIDVRALLDDVRARAVTARGYVDAYRRYMRPMHAIDDLAIAPFHLLASEGAVHADRDHAWHMRVLSEICSADSRLFVATQNHIVDLGDEKQLADAIAWWTELTGNGGEGVVVKPFDFVTRSGRGIVQPALKVRGAEYLRIVYGPEYSLPRHLDRLRERAIAEKRRLALDEFVLGLESLHRFVERAPLRAVHECVFGVLALESEPVDARL